MKTPVRPLPPLQCTTTTFFASSRRYRPASMQNLQAERPASVHNLQRAIECLSARLALLVVAQKARSETSVHARRKA